METTTWNVGLVGVEAPGSPTSTRWNCDEPLQEFTAMPLASGKCRLSGALTPGAAGGRSHVEGGCGRRLSLLQNLKAGHAVTPAGARSRGSRGRARASLSQPVAAGSSTSASSCSEAPGVVPAVAVEAATRRRAVARRGGHRLPFMPRRVSCAAAPLHRVRCLPALERVRCPPRRRPA